MTRGESALLGCSFDGARLLKSSKKLRLNDYVRSQDGTILLS